VNATDVPYMSIKRRVVRALHGSAVSVSL